MTKKQLNLLLGGVCCACLCVGLGSITATAEETDTATEHTITVDLNGGFTRKGTTYSTDNITYQTTTGTFKLSHENVKVLLGNVDQITAIATDYKEKTVNGIAVDTNGYYSDSTANAIYPSALLFGLFEDSNSDGILNDNEVLYRSGDSIEINRDTTLSCYYETNRTYSTGTASTGDAYLYRAWAMDGKLTDEVTVKNTTKARSEFFDGYGLQETDFAAVGANVNVPTVDTYYTAQDLQPLYNKVTAIGQWAFSCGSGKNNISDTIKGVEIPDTVETIHANAFRWCGKLELIKGLENIKTFERYAFTNFVTDYQQVFVFGEDVSKILSEAFSNTNNVSRFIFTGYDSSLVASPLSLDLYSNAASPSSIFNPRSMQDGTFSYADPNLYIYVPYGETAKYYVMGRTSEEIANDTEVAYTVDGVSANYTVGSGTNYGVLRSNDMLMNKNGKVSNLPIREMQKVVFKLDDQILSTQFMDAGAVSVKRNNTEINVLDDVSQANAESQMVYNPSAQTLSLLSVTAPSLPEKDGYVFAGWKDQFGYVWTDTDFANGGKAGYEVATVELTPLWKETNNYYGKSLSLDGTIGLNVYMNLAEDVVADGTSYMQFTYADGTVEQVTVDKASMTENDGLNVYGFTAKVAAKDAAKNIQATFHFMDGTELDCGTLTVVAVMDEYLEKEDYVATHEVVNALKNYTTAAASYFSNETVVAPETFDADVSNYKFKVSGELNDGITLVGPSLLLEADTVMRIYFNVDSSKVEIADLECKVNGVAVEAQYSGVTGSYYIELANISAQALDAECEFVIGECEIKGSALSYVRVALNSTTTEANLKNLVKYLYMYNSAANTYFGS